MWVIAILAFAGYAAFKISEVRSSNIEGWQVVKVVKKQETKAVQEERAACAAIAEMLERDKTMPDSMRSVAARIRILIQARGA